MKKVYYLESGVVVYELCRGYEFIWLLPFLQQCLSVIIFHFLESFKISQELINLGFFIFEC